MVLRSCMVHNGYMRQDSIQAFGAESLVVDDFSLCVVELCTSLIEIVNAQTMVKTTYVNKAWPCRPIAETLYTSYLLACSRSFDHGSCQGSIVRTHGLDCNLRTFTPAQAPTLAKDTLSCARSWQALMILQGPVRVLNHCLRLLVGDPFNT